MKTMGLLVAITIATVPTESRAQAVRVTVATPTVRFETAPQLVEVSPGVQVVPEYGEEVFFVDGWYWCRAGGAWFRTRDYRGGWVVAERAYVPTIIVKTKPGKYKYYRVAARPQPRPVVVATPPQPPQQVYVPPPPPPRLPDVRVHDVKVGVLRARVIWAKDIHVDDLRCANVQISKIEVKHIEGHAETDRIDANVLFAHDIHAGVIEAEEIHAEHVHTRGGEWK